MSRIFHVPETKTFVDLDKVAMIKSPIVDWRVGYATFKLRIIIPGVVTEESCIGLNVDSNGAHTGNLEELRQMPEFQPAIKAYEALLSAWASTFDTPKPLSF